MFKRLAFVFGAVIVLGFFYYLYSAAAQIVSSGSLPFAPSMVPEGPVAGAFGALKDIDFGQFGKGGAGWKYLTQGYGNTPYAYMYIGRWHNGIDIAADYDAPIHSPVGGVVVAAGDQDDFCLRRAFGRFVVIEDPARHVMLMFAHLDRILVAPGQSIANGAEMATVGATGDETGVHLHFSVFASAGFSMAPAHGCGPYPQGKDMDPIPYLESIE